MATLYVVATPIGNLNDFSPRAKETLSSVSLIAAEDTRQTMKLLNKFEIKTALISYHKFNEQERAEEIVNRMLAENINVALVSDAGTPAISDPGAVLVRKAHENNIEVIGISGPSAAITALSVSGLDLSEFAFFGFLPRVKSEIDIVIKKIKDTPINTFILYESPFRILKTMELISKEFINSSVCVCNDLSKLHEKNLYGTAIAVYNALKANENVRKGEYVIVIQKAQTATMNEKTEQNEPLSIEAELTEIMIKNKCTLKTAQSILHEQNAEYSKKEIYAKALNLKNVIHKK